MNQLPENQEELDDEEFDEYDPTDFGFIIAGDGTLKSIQFPEALMEDPPKEVLKILRIFGIKNIHTLVDHTLH
jgi:hypothetical protein